MPSRLRSALAGSSAALVWAAQEPLDKSLFGCDYSDVAVLGKGLTRGRGWRTAGLAIHAVNGAAFGLAFHEARRRLPVDGRKLALAWRSQNTSRSTCFASPSTATTPRAASRGVPPLLTNGRAFAQATWRHTLFGAVLGRLA